MLPHRGGGLIPQISLVEDLDIMVGTQSHPEIEIIAGLATITDDRLPHVDVIGGETGAAIATMTADEAEADQGRRGDVEVHPLEGGAPTTSRFHSEHRTTFQTSKCWYSMKPYPGIS